jgi:peptidoglycan/xylan/chitin deacetylase (PgdA/CDA1 family)
MKLISPLLKHVLYPGLSKIGHLRWPKDSGPAVLTYHGILPSGYTPRDIALDGHLITADAFRSHLDLLTSKYNVISPHEFRLWCEGQKQLPPRSVLLTCDDGLLNTLTDMLPIIADFGVRFLFFVTGASLLEHSSMLWYEQLYLWLHMQEEICVRAPWRKDAYLARSAREKHALWQEIIRCASALEASARQDALEGMRIQIGISESWQAQYSQNEPLRRRFFMLNRSELQELAQAGMTIGAHTLSHPMLSKMPEGSAWHEISDSRTQMQRLLEGRVWALAYPFGTSEAIGKRESMLARRAGFTCAFSNVENSSGESYSYSRIHVSSGMTLSELEAHLTGFDLAIRHTYSRIMAWPS